mmetsp:Transcript_46150/g.142230  ORF Transcript_46150/g.142230 Transcript_46150/m.142230 type:complete len:239 (+) Transcript_46150:1101-1817(+)
MRSRGSATSHMRPPAPAPMTSKPAAPTSITGMLSSTKHKAASRHSPCRRTTKTAWQIDGHLTRAKLCHHVSRWPESFTPTAARACSAKTPTTMTMIAPTPPAGLSANRHGTTALMFEARLPPSLVFRDVWQLAAASTITPCMSSAALPPAAPARATPVPAPVSASGLSRTSSTAAAVSSAAASNDGAGGMTVCDSVRLFCRSGAAVVVVLSVALGFAVVDCGGIVRSPAPCVGSTLPG